MARQVSFARCCILVLLFGALFAAARVLPAAAGDVHQPLSLDPTEAGFRAFQIRFGKTYANAELRNAAYAHYKTSVKRALRAKVRNPQASFALNRRSDMPPTAPVRLPKMDSLIEEAVVAPLPATGVPTMLDWRTRGAVTPVPNMGQCGCACVAFAYSGVGAAVNKINGFTPSLVELSAQQLVDCSGPNCQCMSGCELDTPAAALIANDGLWDTSASYNYVSEAGNNFECWEHNKSVVPGAKFTKFVKLPKRSEESLMSEIQKAPFGVGVKSDVWCEYQGGIITDCGEGQNIDNSVMLVGYNDAEPTPYWILRTNWGAEYGEDGYVYVAKANNTCLVQDYPFTLQLERLH